MKANVLVMLSTYNGEKYITEQIDSILNQQGVNVRIIIRDDGSGDSTVSILEDFAKRFPQQIDLSIGDNIGCRQSFSALMNIAAERYDYYDYYAFSDQDDVWLFDKLIAGVTALEKITNPLKTYYCQPMFVDENLEIIKTKGFINNRSTLAESFLISPSIGCAMIFSPGILRKAAALSDEGVDAMHDSITYKLTLALGGVIIEDPVPHILYRQHSSNTIGTVQAKRNRFKRWKKAFLLSERQKSAIASAILEFYNREIPTKEKYILSLLDSYTSRPSKKIRLLFSREFASNSRIHNIMFRIAVLFNKF